MAEEKIKSEDMAEAQDNTDIAEESKSADTKKKKEKKTKEQKKIDELQTKIEEFEAQINQLKDQNLRKIAEFENFKRRTEKEFLAHLEFANEGLITEILPVLDDFERFLDHADEPGGKNPLKEGVELIYKKMYSILEKKGLKVMDVIGKEFDTEQHEALMQIETDKQESGHIVDQHLKGYLINDKVIRHAQVLVAK
ncbi:MAG: nucleotide exchange factor GrpE [Calditrichaceae bacterium]|nr:nucleotide exchange factor GrpE [Calditrichaceae bacterium]